MSYSLVDSKYKYMGTFGTSFFPCSIEGELKSGTNVTVLFEEEPNGELVNDIKAEIEEAHKDLGIKDATTLFVEVTKLT